jgi:DNA replication protein DnaC
MGMRVFRRPDGSQVAEPCECRHEQRVSKLLERAHIPRRYQHCSFESYEAVFPGSDRSLAAAHLMARRFVDGYPATTEGHGLLLTGSIGIGKTHLAVGILQSLIVEKGVRGLFCDYRELLKEIQHSYNPQVLTTELDILRPVFDAEVLVLDELGASKPTEWVWDTVAHILNTRYNDKRTTIITTNYPDQAPGAAAVATTAAQRAMREETLGDRIGERMRSRLAEMCVVIEMRGDDFRRTVGRARFA